MSKLNEKNERTEKIVHLMITSLCNRNCKFCCNKQYNLNDIPYVTDEELKNCDVLCLTGGEPFLFSDPCEIAEHYKKKYFNIKKVYVYTNMYELGKYLEKQRPLHSIDGLNISIKNKLDKTSFETWCNAEAITNLKENRLYVFDNLYPSNADPKVFDIMDRKWQEDFEAADDSIFRKV